MEHPDKHVSSERLIEAVKQLTPAELDRFADEVVSLRARQRASALTAEESDLYDRINDALAEEDRARLDVLRNRRRDETLSDDEHQDLIRLEDRLELLHARRMEALAGLASLRESSLEAVMEQLGIAFPSNA